MKYVMGKFTIWLDLSGKSRRGAVAQREEQGEVHKVGTEREGSDS